MFYREDAAGKRTWYNPLDVALEHDDKGRPVSATLKADGQPVQLGGIEKMSKSKNNVVDPQGLIDQYGADTARLFTMFAAHPEQSLEWSGSGVEGAHRFLRRLWAFCHAQRDMIRGAGPLDVAALGDAERALRYDVHAVLKQANYDFERLQYNTVVSAGMKLLNALESFTGGATPQGAAALADGARILVSVLSPVVPHVTHALWNELGLAERHGPLLDAAWPQVDETALVRSQIELVLQINGKVRGAIRVAADADKAVIEAAALASEPFTRLSEGRPARKVVVVPGRLVNVVV